MSPYIQRLRDAIGHELLLLPSVVVLVWDPTGRLLLVRESQTLKWQTVGGGVEPDESPSDAARREALEEAGLTVHLDALRCVVGGPGFRLTYTNGDHVSYVATVYDATIVAGTPEPDRDEIVEIAWFACGELPRAECTPFTVALFAELGLLSAT